MSSLIPSLPPILRQSFPSTSSFHFPAAGVAQARGRGASEEVTPRRVISGHHHLRHLHLRRHLYPPQGDDDLRTRGVFLTRCSTDPSVVFIYLCYIDLYYVDFVTLTFCPDSPYFTKILYDDLSFCFPQKGFYDDLISH